MTGIVARTGFAAGVDPSTDRSMWFPDGADRIVG
jgi:hypothetical protein